jgi:hypothetical protein
MDEKSWPVAFHGVGINDKLAIKNIIENGLIKGEGQAYEDDKCTRTKKIIGKGVYFSPLI